MDKACPICATFSTNLAAFRDNKAKKGRIVAKTVTQKTQLKIYAIWRQRHLVVAENTATSRPKVSFRLSQDCPALFQPGPRQITRISAPIGTAKEKRAGFPPPSFTFQAHHLYRSVFCLRPER
jgi:hypothetical protein